ncbi:MAG: c-type cytochrome domain-containing protein, partial [Pirellula sp.]
MRLNLSSSLPILGGFVLLSLVLNREIAVGQIRFNESVRPILSDKCFFCHGPDAANRQADLRLDDRNDAITKGAITPGNLDESEILLRIHSEDPDLQMPPPTSKLPKLTKEEVAILEQWIREGAPYQKHWAFESLDWDRLAPYIRKNLSQGNSAQ